MDPLSLVRRHLQHRQRLAEFRARLYRTAYAWTHDPALADDLVQETLARGLRRADQLRDLDALPAWLFGILTNCWRDHLRRERHAYGDVDGLLDKGPSPEEVCELTERALEVRRAVATLPLGQRQVLTLVDLEGFRYAEVAQILDIPVGTVMSRLCRARRALTEILQPLAPARDISAPTLWRVK